MLHCLASSVAMEESRGISLLNFHKNMLCHESFVISFTGHLVHFLIRNLISFSNQKSHILLTL